MMGEVEGTTSPYQSGESCFS